MERKKFMELKLYSDEAELGMDEIIDNYENNLTRISTGRANPKIFEKVKIHYYDEFIPLTQVAAISVPESQQILIKPFDPSIIKEILSALQSSQLGFTAINEGDKIRINLPELTTSRRKELVKQIAKYEEEARIGIRAIRQKIRENIKRDKQLTEDDEHYYLEQIQNLTDKYNARIQAIHDLKTKELMTF